MATIQLRKGQNPVSFLAATAVAFSSLSWYNSTNISKIYAVNANGTGYSTNTPGSAFGPQSFVPLSDGTISGYVIVTKAAISVDASMFAPTTVPAPTISRLAPTSLAPGDVLNISGTNLGNTGYVIVGGVSAAIINGSITSTNVAVTVPLTAATGSNIPVVICAMNGYVAVATLTITATATKLAKPVITTPVSVTSTSATFSWAAVSGADRYYFRLNSGTVYPLANVTSYTASGLSASTAVTGEVYASDSTGAKQNSDYSALVSATTNAAGAKLPLIVAFGNSQTYGPNGSGDSLIGSAGHEAWPDVMLADLNSSTVTYAAKVFGHPGYSTVDLLNLLQSEVKPWLDANASQYGPVTVILQELVNDANNYSPAHTENEVYQHFAQLITDAKALPTVSSVSMLTGYPNTAGSYTNELIVRVNTRLKEARNTLGIKQVFDVRTLKYVLDFSNGTTDDGIHLNPKGNDLVGHFIANGIRSGAGLVQDPTYVAPIVYNFTNATFDKVPSGASDWQRSMNTQWAMTGNGDATISNAVATSNEQDLWFFQTVPLEIGKQYKVVADADVPAGSFIVNINPGTPGDQQLLPGGGNVPFTATANSALAIFKATPGTAAVVRSVGISVFIPAGGSKGLFNNSNFADVPDGTDTNWKTYPGWTIIGNGKAQLDASQNTNGQVYLFQTVSGLDTTKQYRMRFEGNMDTGGQVFIYGLSGYLTPQTGAPAEFTFTPGAASMQFIIEGQGTGYLSNVILALDDANFPA